MGKENKVRRAASVYLHEVVFLISVEIIIVFSWSLIELLGVEASVFPDRIIFLTYGFE